MPESFNLEKSNVEFVNTLPLSVAIIMTPSSVKSG